MKLELALLADFANKSADGKLNILGTFNRIWSQKFPAVHPEMKLVLRFAVHPAEVDDAKKMKIQLRTDDGRVMIELRPHGGRYNAITTAQVQIIPPRVPYAAVVREDEATDGGTKLFLAEVPELPGCMSHGETPQEALQGLEEAIELYLKAMDEGGVERPVVQFPPTTGGTSLNGMVAIQTSEYEISGEMTVALKPAGSQD